VKPVLDFALGLDILGAFRVRGGRLTLRRVGPSTRKPIHSTNDSQSNSRIAICRDNSLTMALQYVWKFAALCNQRHKQRAVFQSQSKTKLRFLSQESFSMQRARSSIVALGDTSWSKTGLIKNLGVQCRSERSKKGDSACRDASRIVSLEANPLGEL
jgi:hypothetical protein